MSLKTARARVAQAKLASGAAWSAHRFADSRAASASFQVRDHGVLMLDMTDSRSPPAARVLRAPSAKGVSRSTRATRRLAMRNCILTYNGKQLQRWTTRRNLFLILSF